MINFLAWFVAVTHIIVMLYGVGVVSKTAFQRLSIAFHTFPSIILSVLLLLGVK